jgi:integrase
VASAVICRDCQDFPEFSRRKENVGKIAFTKRTLEKLVAPTGARPALYRDSVVRGLGIKVEPSDHRAFFWSRKVNGRAEWETIGEFPDVSVEVARARATEFNHKLGAWKASGYAGPNPFEKTSKHGFTLDQLTDAYVEQHLKQHAKRPERAEKRLRWMLKFYVSSWRSRKLSDITQEDVAAFHRLCGTEHGHRTANHVVKTLRTLFNFGTAAKLWSGENPARGIRHGGIRFFPENKRTRFLQPHELPQLWTALRKSPNQDFIDYVNLALWTGARKSDVLSMRWQDISLSDNRWTIPDPKNRTPYVVPLTPEAIQILKARLKIRASDNPWVFPSHGKSGHIVDLKGRWKQLLKDAGLDYPDQSELKITQHDLRRTQGSWLAGQGTSLPIIAKVLGHASTDATQIYARLNLDPVRQAMESSNAALLAAMKKKPAALPPAVTERKKRPAVAKRDMFPFSASVRWTLPDAKSRRWFKEVLARCERAYVKGHRNPPSKF